MAKIKESRMKNYSACGVTAKFMHMLAGINASTISRAISENKLVPLPESSRRNCRYSVETTRRILKDFIKSRHPIDITKKVHSFYNFKGGTGKTTLAYQVSSHLALCGYKVLVVDTDPQGQLTVSFGFLDNLELKTLYDGLVSNYEPSEITINIYQGLDLIPANLSLIRLEKNISDMTRREFVLEKYLREIKDEYDFIIFDCNPSISYLNRNVLNFTDQLNIICETHPYSVNAIGMLMTDLERYYNDLDASLPEILIIPSKYEDRSNTSAEALSLLSRMYSEYLIPNFAVRKSEDFLKASRDQMPIAFFCKANSIAFEDISDLLKIIVEKSEKNSTS